MGGLCVLDQLGRVVDDVEAFHSKLVLLIAEGNANKSYLLREFALRRGVAVVNLGIEMGKQLAQLPVKRRALGAPLVLSEVADRCTKNGVLLLDNIEVLFDRSLRLDPLDMLKQVARTRRMVVAWPGYLREGRLIYAELGHPEYQDYGVDGLVPFEIK